MGISEMNAVECAYSILVRSLGSFLEAMHIKLLKGVSRM